MAQQLVTNKHSKDQGDIHQGDCVNIINEKNLFQVIGVDNIHKKCWVREWPLLTNGSPVFEIPLSQIKSATS